MEEAASHAFLHPLVCLFRVCGVNSCVGIHNGHRGNKVDGLSDLDGLNKTTSRTAGRGLKNKNKETTDKTSGEAKQVKQGALGW